MSSDSFLGRLRDAQGPARFARPARSPQPPASRCSTSGPGSPAPPPASTLPPGLADHPDYEIIRELGRGGMGVVYLAHNRLMGRDEVLKVVSSHLIERRGVLDRFLREIRAAAKLHHPNIVTAYSAFRLGESIVFAMEYVEGLDLAKLVKAKGPLPVAHACNFVHQAALGLQHAHEQGMVHRDIKPSNLMLARQGNRAVVKVLDFGLAKVEQRGAGRTAALTHEGQMLGTPDFIAPEQIVDAQKADIRADIYSLGCTLYYLLTGGPPFQGTSLYDIFQAHHSMDAEPLNLVRPEVPVELAALVAKMMAKEPARRFQKPEGGGPGADAVLQEGECGRQESRSRRSPRPVRRGRSAKGSVHGDSTETTRRTGTGCPTRRRLEPSAPEARWKSLIDFPGDGTLTVDATPSRPARRPPWCGRRWLSGCCSSGFVAIWLGVVLRVKTPDGDLVFDGPPEHAVVTIDGRVMYRR